MPAGPYKSEAYGQVDVTIPPDTDRVVAKASGGVCGFEPGTEVLTGEFQGSVLVGKLLVCQEGDTCEPKQEAYPVMAIYNPASRVLSALVRLREGCTSKVRPVANQPVMFQSLAPVEDERRARDGSPAPSRGAAPEPEGSATQVARAQAKAPEVAPLELGQRLLAERNYRQAQYQFANALQADRRNVTAQVGLAASLLGLGDVRGALEMLEGIPKKSPEVFLWLAYAHQRNKDPVKAREFVGKVVGMGFIARPMDADAEQALQAELNAAREQRRKQMMRPQTGPGSTRP